MTTDFDTLRARFAELPEPSGAVRDAARARLLEEITLSAAWPASSPRIGRSPRRKLVIVALAAAAVVVAPLAIAAAVYFRDFPRPSDVPRSAEPTRVGPKLVSAEGETDGVSWRLVLYRARDEDEEGASRLVLCQQLQLAGEVSATGGGCGIPAFRGGVSRPEVNYIAAGVDRTWLYGRVSSDAVTVTLVLADGRMVEAETFETPKVLRLPYDYYVAVENGEIGSRLLDAVREVIARDASGGVVGRARVGG